MSLPHTRRSTTSPSTRLARQLKQIRRRGETLAHQLRQRHWLRLHVACIALLTLAATWLASALLMHAGMTSLAARYAIALPLGYGFYLLLLRAWAGSLLSRRESDAGIDIGDPGLPGDTSGSSASTGGGTGGDAWHGDGGGDFAGGGADASWDAGDSPVSELAGQALEGAGSVLEGADEGAVVAIPFIVVLGLLALLAGLFGVGLFALFGVDVLVAVAVELLLASAAGSLAYKGFAEGWLGRALRHTWRGALGALVLAVLLGLVIDHYLPAAHSLPDALYLLRHAGG